MSAFITVDPVSLSVRAYYDRGIALIHSVKLSKKSDGRPAFMLFEASRHHRKYLYRGTLVRDFGGGNYRFEKRHK